MDKADVLEYYEQSVRSVQLEYFLPAVLRVRRHRGTSRHTQVVTLNRANVMLRDRYSCQYCGSSRELTIDHVVPQVGSGQGGGAAGVAAWTWCGCMCWCLTPVPGRHLVALYSKLAAEMPACLPAYPAVRPAVPQSKGGGNTWSNLVACCASCNSKKGDKSLEQLRWKLRQQPKVGLGLGGWKAVAFGAACSGGKFGRVLLPAQEPSMHEMEFVLSMLLGSTNQDLLPPEWQVRGGGQGCSRRRSLAGGLLAPRLKQHLTPSFRSSLSQAYIVPFTRSKKKKKHAS